MLIGVAEQRRSEGLVRTAMIATEGDVLTMALIGDSVLLRYKVSAIGVDFVELTDVTTNRVRRLTLQ
jgi:hypothetical protein